MNEKCYRNYKQRHSTSRDFTRLSPLAVAARVAILVTECDGVWYEATELEPAACSRPLLALWDVSEFTLSLWRGLCAKDLLLVAWSDRAHFDLSSIIVGRGRLLNIIPEFCFDKLSSVNSSPKFSKEPEIM